ncbi:MAG: NAD(P)H-dependent oxidoreductase subunit E [Nitrospinae bacterium]|nr:NAD(P)H-dependent oxidoreductase subunit E [Nitrospinota bacterium]
MSQPAATTVIPDEEEDLSYVDEVLAKYKNARGAIIPVLQKVQVHYGYLPRKAMLMICDATRMTLAQLAGVATFYAQFRLTPRGKYMLKICCGTACHVKGSLKLVEKALEKLDITPGETTVDKLFTVEKVACIGACSLAPVITVNNEAVGYLDADMFTGIMNDLKDGKRTAPA